VVKFEVHDEDDPDEARIVFEPVCRKWLVVDNESGAIGCKWPPEKLTSKKLESLVHKQVEPAADWVTHSCEVISTYGK